MPDTIGVCIGSFYSNLKSYAAEGDLKFHFSDRDSCNPRHTNFMKEKFDIPGEFPMIKTAQPARTLFRGPNECRMSGWSGGVTRLYSQAVSLLWLPPLSRGIYELDSRCHWICIVALTYWETSCSV